VVARLEGSDAQLQDEYLVYSAHGITSGGIRISRAIRSTTAPSTMPPAPAQLLEIAHAFARSATRPRRSILFIATTGEEQGLLESHYYAQHPLLPIAKTVANINLDDGALSFASDQIEFAKFGIPTAFPFSGFEFVGKPEGFGEQQWAA
jgi:hypothetical protein